MDILTLEQQFKLQILREEVKKLSLEQAQDYLIEVLQQNMLKDNVFKQMLKDNI
ncbi:MAG: NblA/ycf18 family protein [Microcoleaceae cyanobacterium]